MSKFTRCLAALCVGILFICTAAAQGQSQSSTSIPKVLQITREYTKPGKAGMIHDQKESAFVQAMARANWPTHYLGMTSLSGKQRALFLTSYPSFEAWQKDSEAVAKNSALSTALDRAGMADGELLDSMDQGVFVFREEMSLRPRADLSPMRYMEVSVYHVRPGHGKEWIELLKMVNAGYQKAVPEAHWGCFEEMYGGDGGTYIFFTGRKSLAEIDGAPQDDKLFAAAMGEDGMKELDELFGAAVESSQQQLSQINPRMSYVADEWIKADPEFWKPKAASTAATPAAGEKKAKP
jgi:hypothetical protein